MIESISILIVVIVIPSLVVLRIVSYRLCNQLLQEIYTKELEGFNVVRHITFESIWDRVGGRNLFHWERLAYSVSFILFSRYRQCNLNKKATHLHDQLIQLSRIELILVVLFFLAFIATFSYEIYS